MRKLVLLFLGFTISAVLQKTAAQTFSLLKDINEADADNTGGSGPRSMVDVNGIAYFVAYTKATGYELWKSDGTPSGTIMVKDILPGTETSLPQNLTNVNGTLYFKADDGMHGYELWKSDGTPAGTTMVKDINPGIAGNNLMTLVDVNGTLFFVATDGVSGPILWKSNGTLAGTAIVKSINAFNLTNSNGVLYFSANDGVNGEELWKSDGTPAGTVMIKDIYPGNGGSGPTGFININGTTYFSAFGSYFERELWKTDGTTAGTVMVKDIRFVGSSNPEYLTNLNGTLFFVADASGSGKEIWKSDGTAAGTVLVKDIVTGYESSEPASLIAINNLVLFTAQVATGDIELWKTDGTDAGTELVKDIWSGSSGSNPQYFSKVNGNLLFTAQTSTGRELWKSDGTNAGTVLVKDINPGAAHGIPTLLEMNFASSGNLLFFIANDGVTGVELWKSDGTAAGTTLVKDIVPPLSGNGIMQGLEWFVEINGILYFAANDGINGGELWKTDGTAAGTVMVKDINPGSEGSYPWKAVNLNGVLIFAARNATNGEELWKSDGTPAGTVMLKDIDPGAGHSSPEYMVRMGNAVYFNANNGSLGEELWKTDGTAPGTVLVKDILAGAQHSRPQGLIAINNTLYFSALDATNGYELWKSDGTTGGTVMVKDINPGSAGSFPNRLTNINGHLYFAATTAANGEELWGSNGTPAGTIMQVDLCPGTCSGQPTYITDLFGIVFYVGFHPSQGREFRSLISVDNGIIGDLNPGPGDSDPRDFIKVNNTIYFTAENPSTGRELYKHDWTTGLSMVKDVWPGSGSGTGQLFNAQDHVFFTGNNGVSGDEPWRTDGTAAGTVMVQDIFPIGASSPSTFATAGGKLYTVMIDQTHGKELWVANLATALPLTLLEFNGRLVNDDAVLNWKTTGELQTQSFDIERSLDGRNYLPVGNVRTANTAGIHSYTYTDRNFHSPGVTKLYYRLKQIDINGRFSYSRIVVLSLPQSEPAILLYPNPVINELNLTVSLNRPDKLQTRVYDNSGKTLLQQQWQISTGSTSLSLDVSKLSKGIYFVELKGETINEVKKFMKH